MGAACCSVPSDVASSGCTSLTCPSAGLVRDRFSILQVTARPICDLNACSDAPGRLMQMASVHVGTDTDYSFTNRKDERAALLASRHHGVKAQQRGFLAETTAAHPVAAAAQSY
ncbi:MAG: hypothetical protein ACPIOQ_08010 [Promethearchaeia archaeon]